MFVRLKVGQRDVRIVRWSGFTVLAGALALGKKMTRGPEMTLQQIAYLPTNFADAV